MMLLRLFGPDSTSPRSCLSVSMDIINDYDLNRGQCNAMLVFRRIKSALYVTIRYLYCRNKLPIFGRSFQ